MSLPFKRFPNTRPRRAICLKPGVNESSEASLLKEPFHLRAEPFSTKAGAIDVDFT